jgi:pantoate--beta-alanine ligase
LRILRLARDVREWREGAKPTVGFVPTMGALHDGHLSLVKRSQRDTGATIVSIFVNPTQFGPNEDFTKYPRREAEDLAMLERARVDAAFAPPVEELYPPGDTRRIDPGAIAAPLEGAARPGHFTGVATVVAKLFDIVRPDIAYFGQKDFQQLRVLQTMARARFPEIRVIGCPIVRERDGLAMSSRNAYLSASERHDALALSRGLRAAQELWERGERDPERLRMEARETVRATPGVALEYVSAADPLTLAELTAPSDRTLVSLAARVGKTRLIDNVLLGMDVNELS